MRSMKATIHKAVRGELRVNGETHAYAFEPGDHDVHPDVFAALSAAGIASRPAKRKETTR